MAKTHAEFIEWAQSVGIDPVILIEAQHSTGTVYLSDRNYVTGNAETPANISYDVCLSNSIVIEKSIDEVSIGAIRVFNDGSLDDWENLEWENQSFKIWFGDCSWARDDFKLMFNGTITQLTSTAALLMEFIVTSAEATIITEVGDLYGLVVGNVTNMPAIGAGSDYGTVFYRLANTDFYDKNSLVVTVGGTEYEADFGSPFLHAFTLTGLLSPGSTPICSATSTILKLKQFIQHICNVAGVTIHQESFDNFPDYDIGARFRSSQSLPFDTAITEALSGVGGFYRINEDTELEIYQLNEPSTQQAITHFDSSIIKSLVQASTEAPLKTLKAQYNIDHQTTPTFSTLTKSNTIADGIDFIESKTVNSMVAAPDLIPESNRQLALRLDKKRTYKVVVERVAAEVFKGAVVKVTYPDAGWRNGTNAIVVGFSLFLTKNQTEIIVWR